jgi:rhodanese-related sulfurtransferase
LDATHPVFKFKEGIKFGNSKWINLLTKILEVITMKKQINIVFGKNRLTALSKIFWNIVLLVSIGWSANTMAEDNTKNKERIEAMIADFSNDFSVPEVDVTTAKRLLSDKTVLFLDVREQKEIEVSKIPNAITKEQFEDNPEIYKDKKIIAYCTIGYRSSKFAEKWNKRGFKMSNLRGSLLLWTHAEGALVDTYGKPTNQVHVYGKKWNLIPKSYQSIY